MNPGHLVENKADAMTTRLNHQGTAIRRQSWGRDATNERQWVAVKVNQGKRVQLLQAIPELSLKKIGQKMQRTKN